MSDLDDLYQETILDHCKKPRNFGALEAADRQADGHNPLCGDRLTLHVKMKGDRIEDVRFKGSGCAISTASASLMTEAIKGMSGGEVTRLFGDFTRMVKGESHTTDLGKLEAFAGVSEFPVRVKCATLAWHTLKAALDGKQEAVSTED